MARTTCFARLSRRSSTFAIRWCGWRGDPLGLSGATLQLGVLGGTRAAAVADAAGGRVIHSQAYAQPLGRGAVRANGWRTRISSTSVFRHELPFDRSSLTRWRQRLGEEQVAALLQESLSVAHCTGAIDTKDLERVAIDTTVQEKAIAHPTDARLTHRAIEKLVELAKREGVELRQSYLRLAKRAAIMVRRYTHAHQFKRTRRELTFLRTRLGRIIPDICRKIEGNTAREDRFGPLLDVALRVRHQEQRQRGPKVYSLHAPEVECIGRGKARSPYEFGCKVSIATPVTAPKGGQFVLHPKALHGNPSPRPSAARCAGAPPSNPSSATSRRITV